MISENFDISCNNVAIFSVIIKLATQTIFESSSLELKDRKVSDPKVMFMYVKYHTSAVRGSRSSPGPSYRL